MSRPVTDRQLTDRQRTVLDRLIRENWRALSRFAWKLHWQDQRFDAEDILAYGLQRIALSFPTYDPRKSKFITWAGRVVYGVFLHFKVYQARLRRPPSIDQLTDKHLRALADPDPGPDELAVGSVAVHQVLAKLKPTEVAALVDWASGAEPRRSVADQGLTYQTVYKRRQNALQRARANATGWRELIRGGGP